MGILFSILIPTYNRAKYLKKTLESIVCLPEFLNTDKVEIVISDNASSDETKMVCEDFVRRFPDKIIYNRNEKNVGAELNCLKLIKMANGVFLKLNNDTVCYKENTLSEILNYIESNMEEKPILLFMNKGKNKTFSFSSCEELLNLMSYKLTWIGTVGFWSKDIDYIIEKIKSYYISFIPFTFLIYDQLKETKNARILAKSIFEVQNVDKKGGYNFVKVFGENYLNFLCNLKNDGYISLFSLEKEKILLLKHINLGYFDINNGNCFEKDGYFKYLMKYYWYNPYFYAFYAYMSCLKFLKSIPFKAV